MFNIMYFLLYYTSEDDIIGVTESLLCAFIVLLQISEVVNSMKDLIDFSRQTGKGPIGKIRPFLLLLILPFVSMYHCQSMHASKGLL